MKFKIIAKPTIKNLEIGDIVEVSGTSYVVAEYRETTLGMRVWGESVNGGKLTHLFGLEFYKDHVRKGQVKLMHHVQD